MWQVYICDKNDKLYTGITTDIGHRLKQHKAMLLYSEEYSDKHSAARRERQIKGWSRKKKLTLIENPR
jgi:putative endonuclease